MHRRTRSHRQRKVAAASPRQIRNRWVAWIMVALMLAAMTMYVLSLDELIVP